MNKPFPKNYEGIKPANEEEYKSLYLTNADGKYTPAELRKLDIKIEGIREFTRSLSQK